MSLRSFIPTGQPECQEYRTVARDGTLLIFAAKSCGFVGAGLALLGEGAAVADWDGVVETAGGGEAVADVPPPQADESATQAPVMTAARVTRCITEGLHAQSRASCRTCGELVCDRSGNRGPIMVGTGEKRRPPLGMREITAVGSGLGTFILVDAVMMYSAFEMNVMHGKSFSLLSQALALLLLAFGLGGFLAWKMTGFMRLYGVGLMCGWTFLTLFSLGFCTGLNA
jgi:hypothetical protein